MDGMGQLSKNPCLIFGERKCSYNGIQAGIYLSYEAVQGDWVGDDSMKTGGSLQCFFSRTSYTNFKCSNVSGIFTY